MLGKEPRINDVGPKSGGKGFERPSVHTGASRRRPESRGIVQRVLSEVSAEDDDVRKHVSTHRKIASLTTPLAAERPKEDSAGGTRAASPAAPRSSWSAAAKVAPAPRGVSPPESGRSKGSVPLTREESVWIPVGEPGGSSREAPKALVGAQETPRDTSPAPDEDSEGPQGSILSVHDPSGTGKAFAYMAHDSEGRQWLLFPDSPFKTWWEVFMLACVLYFAVEAPLRIAFTRQDSTVWRVCDVVLLTVWVADIIISFRSAIRENGEVIVNTSIIARRYLRGWFTVDALAALPIDTVVWWLAPVATAPLFRLSRLARLLRTLRGTRVAGFLETTSQFNPAAIRLAKLMALLLVMWHWVACAYWFVCEAEDFAVGDPFFDRDGENRWMPPAELWCENPAACPTLADCFAAGECPAPVGRKYLFALFWALMTTTGVGRDVEPVSELEHIFTVVMIATGLIVNALLIGSASSAINNLDSISTERRHKLEAMTGYMRQRHVPEALQRRIRAFYEYMWSTHGALVAEGEAGGVLADLHPLLRLDLHVSINLRLLRKVSIFREITDSECLIDLIDKLKPKIFIPGEYVCIEGDVGTEMFVVVKGIVNIIVGPQQKVVDQSGAGDVIGESALLLEQRRSASICAVTYCDVRVLEKEDFKEVMRRYPEIVPIIQRLFFKRYSNGWQKLADVARMAHACRAIGSVFDMRYTLLGESSTPPQGSTLRHPRTPGTGIARKLTGGVSALTPTAPSPHATTDPISRSRAGSEVDPVLRHASSTRVGSLLDLMPSGEQKDAAPGARHMQ